MNGLLVGLREVEEHLDTVIAGAFRAETIPDLPSPELADMLVVSGRIARRLESAQLEAAAQVRSRSTGAVAEKMTTLFGCSSPIDLVRMLLGTDTNQAARLVRAGKQVGRERNITTGGFLPARYPALYAAVRDGVIGVAGLLAATGPLERAAARLGEEDRLAADAELAAFARGTLGTDETDETDETDGDNADDAPRPLPLPEDLAVLAQVITAYLDPDGAEPAEQEGLRNRSLRIGGLRDGVHRVTGALLPEVAAQLQLLLDSVLNPRIDAPDDPEHRSAASSATGGDGDGPVRDGDTAASDRDGPVPGGVRFEPSSDDDLRFGNAPDDPTFVDTRTRPQKLHDALAAILKTTAETDLHPHLGGAAPTLVVTATADDLAHAATRVNSNGRGAGDDTTCTSGTGPGPGPDRPVPMPGWGTLLNTGTPIPLPVAFHTACTGSIQRILFDPHGRIVGLGTSARIFNALQRRAITLRDGGCIIPGCTVPATWCEIHHVKEHSDGGPTHTDNGVLLCWWHHRTLHLTEWTIRIRDGIPEIQGPTWWDPHQHWHQAQSPHRQTARRRERQPAPA